MKRVVEDYIPPDELLLPHTMGRGFFFHPEDRPPGADKSYDTNSAFWRDVLDEKVIAERTVLLQGFRVFEWIPRNPGLYHTWEAAYARQAAQEFMQFMSLPAFEGLGKLASGPPDHAALFRKATEAQGSARQLIYTPAGKVSMLQGGIGCVRLSPVELKKGGHFWFMSATSTNAPDEGILLLMGNDVYQTLIDEIRTVGSARRDLVGRTKFVPNKFRDLYSHKNGIPRMYIEVSDVRAHTNMSKGSELPNHGEVSVAASFLSEYEGYPRIYASYVTFDPAYQGARRSAAQWMKEEYIEGLYQGSILTDFDQQMPSIADTLFSLDQVLTSDDLAKQIAIVKKRYGHFNWDMLEKSTLSFHLHEESVMVNVNASGQGNIINIAKYINDVHNTVNQNVNQSTASEEIKNLIKGLAEQIAAVSPQIEPAIAQTLGKNLESLSKELNSESPEKRWYQVSLDGLKEAAVAIGELATPILSTVSKLAPLLLQ